MIFSKNVENVRKKLETLPELSEKEKKKADKILSNPAGWSKDRHSNYPTTDLNVVVAFSKEDKLKLKKLLVGDLCVANCTIDFNSHVASYHVKGCET